MKWIEYWTNVSNEQDCGGSCEANATGVNFDDDGMIPDVITCCNLSYTGWLSGTCSVSC
jgi:hypothetical protein